MNDMAPLNRGLKLDHQDIPVGPDGYMNDMAPLNRGLKPRSLRALYRIMLSDERYGPAE